MKIDQAKRANVVVTGGAKRGGAAICHAIHDRGYSVIIQCRESSLEAAKELAAKLNSMRLDSASVWCVDLSQIGISPPPNSENTIGIVANASEYRKSHLGDFSNSLDQDLQTHLTNHLSLIQLLKTPLMANRGSVVAITDIRTNRPKKGYLSYQVSKGALDAAVRSLAVDLAPEIRVNAVAPGPLQWPTNPEYSEERKRQIIDATPMGRVGEFSELASAVCFLLFDATYTTGATIPVDGGRTIYLV
ncbi:SDR family oxidoreductase [Polynucleobacter sp. JS-Polo-80-F4]|uniref:SDR family oxidoreductase n=1 Tax=Polynucleobacter sp. JS-Polo-80-F4 TaxID=2576918 RepID=UPI001C0CD181|nr:SDR family oxidoreductase [Polynucleobacter sp. JS-Polo-80-F4]MBU3615842.1 SDR family oxidoreductase [Polynucleobacter sp. JS-Polo-80-F4]